MLRSFSLGFLSNNSFLTFFQHGLCSRFCCLLFPFLSLYFSKYIFSELPGEKCPLFLTKVSCTLFCANKLLTIHIQNKNLLNENFHEKEDNVGSCLKTATIFYSSVLKEIAAYILPPTSVTPWTGALFGL